MPRPRPLLAATLIVRDEESRLADCLARLEGVVDEVVVYDTGSRDGTRDLARAAGARVLAGSWHDDFARARNAALGMTRARWALSVDADDRLQADGSGLRALLQARPGSGAAGDVEAFLLRVVSRDPAGRLQAAHNAVRLVRTDGARWDGRVHEVLLPGRDGALRALLPPDLARIEHLGYLDAATIRAKAERNLTLAQAELDRLFAGRSDDRGACARVLLNLARSAVELGQRQLAVDALEALREIVDDGPQRALGTVLLAQLLLDAGGFEEVVLVLEAELRADDCVDPRLADWLRAQAMAGLGRPDDALALLRGIDRLVDPAGVEHPLDRVLRARAVLAALAGHADEAREALLAAMLDHGAVTGNADLLRLLFAERPAELEAALADAGLAGRDRYLPDVRAELLQVQPA